MNNLALIINFTVMGFLYAAIAIVAAIVVLAVMAPRRYEVRRSIVINRQRKEVYDYLRMLRHMEQWSAWARKDPDLVREYRGVDGQVGAISAWQGNADVGQGEQEIVALEPDRRIDSRLRFFKPWKSESEAFFELVDTGEGYTRVDMGFQGKGQLPFSIFMLFLNMDRMIGKDFEEGLESLKQVLESPEG